MLTIFHFYRKQEYEIRKLAHFTREALYYLSYSEILFILEDFFVTETCANFFIFKDDKRR